jgi:hypothetical protein
MSSQKLAGTWGGYSFERMMKSPLTRRAVREGVCAYRLYIMRALCLAELLEHMFYRTNVS